MMQIWRRKGRRAVCAFMLVSTAANQPHERDALADLIAAERRFAADATRIGINAAFRAHVASDAILIRPTPVPARPLLEAQSDGADVTLEWQPAIAAVARSNDLGFTSGPYHMRAAGKLFAGRFVTIWERSPDGRWHWFLDHGLSPMQRDGLEPLPAKVWRHHSGERPTRGTVPPSDADDALNEALSAQGWAALIDRLAKDAQLLRAGREPAARGQARALLAAERNVTGVRRLGTRGSAAGDLAASYGRIERGAGLAPVHYVRIWRLEKDGWRVLLDEVA